jgi:hypothetical protein
MLVRARMAGVTAGAEPEPARAFAPLPPPAGALVPTIGGGAAFCAGLTEPETGERRAAPASPLVMLPAASACLAEYGDACGLPLALAPEAAVLPRARLLTTAGLGGVEDGRIGASSSLSSSSATRAPTDIFTRVDFAGCFAAGALTGAFSATRGDGLGMIFFATTAAIGTSSSSSSEDDATRVLGIFLGPVGAGADGRGDGAGIPSSAGISFVADARGLASLACAFAGADGGEACLSAVVVVVARGGLAAGTSSSSSELLWVTGAIA